MNNFEIAQKKNREVFGDCEVEQQWEKYADRMAFINDRMLKLPALDMSAPMQPYESDEYDWFAVFEDGRCAVLVEVDKDVCIEYAQSDKWYLLAEWPYYYGDSSQWFIIEWTD